MAVCEYRIGRPAPALRRFVERYVSYSLSGFPAGVHVGSPSRFLTFVVSVDGPIDIAALPNASRAPRRLAALVSGLCAAPALIRHDGNEHGVQLELRPLAARALFGMPAAALASEVVELSDALPAWADELASRLADAPDADERFAVLDDVLLRALREPTPPHAAVAYAWRRLLGSSGSIPVAELARDIGWSRRHLLDRFRAEFGLPPKLVAGIVRYERARSLLLRPGRRSLGEIALECGYADQAHLTREFRRFCGASPLAWLAAESLPFVQDGPAAAA